MVTREDMVEQSITDYIRAGLTDRSYVPDVVGVREAFPTPDERASELHLSQLAIGFNFDNGGELWELGSDLRRFLHTVELWVFGVDQVTGRNLAYVCRELLYADDYLVPLKDISQPGAPVIDQLIIDTAAVQRQVSNSTRPWDQYVFTCTAKVEDFYSPSAQAA